MPQNPKPHKKPLVCVNTETGEIVDQWQICWRGPVKSRDAFHLRACVNDTAFSAQNVGAFEKNPTPNSPPPTNEDFGELQPLFRRQKYSKVYQLAEPVFTSDAFAAIWLKVERHTEQDTGVIFLRQRNGTTRPLQKLADWTRLTGKSLPTIKRFLSESYTHDYLARLVFKSTVWWIVNPKYHWNGNLIPTLLHNLFQKRADSAYADLLHEN